MSGMSATGQTIIKRVDLLAQYRDMKQEIDAAVARVLASGHYVLGTEVELFEQEFAQYLGASAAVGVADGTRAIAMALRTLGVSTSDEVITTPLTAIPTIGAIIECGARPVFVDIDPDTYLLDIDRVPAAITSRTRAIVPVHLFGNMVDIPRLRHVVPPSVAIVEDAAQAHGSCLDGVKAGNFGDLATFSFYPTKNLGGYGDGGAIVSPDGRFVAEIKLIRNHGMSDKDTCCTPGFNSRLDELQAAMLRVKLPRLDATNQARGERARQYLAGLPAELFCHQRISNNVDTNWHVFETRFLGGRNALVDFLDRGGIQTNVYYVIPHHLQPALRHLGYKRGDLPNLELVCEQAIALPLYPEIPPRTVQQVIDAIRQFVDQASIRPTARLAGQTS
jgi:dTDP-4-amino-4,6-dideoxygalactose transaminase